MLFTFILKWCSRQKRKFFGPKNDDSDLYYPLETQTTFKDNYILKEQICKGTFGKVYKCIQISTGNEYAVKIMLNKKNLTSVKNEIHILKSVSHPNIVEYKDSYINETSTHIVTEYCDSSDLFDYVINNDGRIKNEREVINVVTQILQGLKYLHDKNIIHRDLKLSNILFHKKNKIKIIDFGLSVIMNDNLKNLEEEVGSIGFISPEIIMGSYNKSCDLWSVGCITFILLFGFNPFDPTCSNDKQLVYGNILKGFRNEDCNGFGAFFPMSIKTSNLSKNFISGLLTDSTFRMDVEEALNHPWLKK